jgi:hypothetical protein
MPLKSPQSELLVVPISLGELVDKITILEIKKEEISDKDKLRNVLHELELLSGVLKGQAIDGERFQRLVHDLGEVNRRLWRIEDCIRDCERKAQFDQEFIQLARDVYKTNDIRARLKREINTLFGSTLVEEKSYSAY